MAASIRKISEDRFVVVSTTHCNRAYVFDSAITITNDIENSKVLQADVRSRTHIIGGKDFR
jgi:hypothetical protein